MSPKLVTSKEVVAGKDMPFGCDDEIRSVRGDGLQERMQMYMVFTCRSIPQ